ncbi:WD40 repeat domain-containing protein [Spirochaeta lutea]|nr:hypothetical protein [Spirochaeta lutea]
MRSGTLRSFLLFVFCSAISVFPGYSQDSQDSLMPNSGHNSAVLTLSSPNLSPFAASMAQDGSILIWNVQENTLADRLFVMEDRPSFLVVHPQRPELFFVARGSDNGYRIEAWNWENHQKLFTKPIPELPLSIAYSPNGTRIVATYPRWDSIGLYNASNGREIRQMTSGYGIVDFASISSSGANMLSYRSSAGEFIYHRIATNEVLAEVKTLRNLRYLNLFPNKRFAVGILNDSLVTLDTVDGSTKSRLAIPRLQIAFPLSDTLVGAIIKEDDRYFIRWISVSNGSLTPAATPRLSRIEQANGIFTVAQDRLIAGLTTGGIASLSPEESVQIAVKRPAAINSFARAGGQLFIGSPQGVFFLDETQILSQLRDRQAQLLQYQKVDLPFSGGIPRMFSLSENDILLWNASSASRIWRLSYQEDTTPSISAITGVHSKTITNLGVEDQFIIVFFRDGSLEVYDRDNYSRILSYSTIGLQDAIIINNDTLLVGKTLTSGFNSSLLAINLFTQETSVVQSQDKVIFDLQSTTDGSEYFTHSISQNSDNQDSTLLRRSHPTLAFRNSILSRYSGEDTGASMAYDSGVLFSSLGMDQLISWDGRRIMRFEKTRRLPRSIMPLEGYVAAINSDGTLSVWNTRTRQFYAELVLLESSEVLILGDNKSILVALASDTPPAEIPGLTAEYLSTLVLLENLRVQSPSERNPEAPPNQEPPPAPATGADSIDQESDRQFADPDTQIPSPGETDGTDDTSGE